MVAAVPSGRYDFETAWRNGLAAGATAPVLLGCLVNQAERFVDLLQRGERSDRVREAVSLLDKRQVDFEYDGDMAADVALNREAMRQYPFCRLSDTANVLIMPASHSASISTKMLRELGGATLIGPMLVGLTHSVQICPLGAKDSDVVNMAALAAYDVNG